MQARCPHCQAVFTAEKTGVQPCPTCGQALDVPPLPAALTPAVSRFDDGTDSTGVDTPWERRQVLGWPKALWQTWLQSVQSPQRFFSTLKPHGHTSDAFLYAWIVWTGGALLAAILTRVIPNNSAEQLLALRDKFPQLPAAGQELINTLVNLKSNDKYTVGLILLAVIGPAFQLIITAGLLHVSCLIFGTAKNGFDATFRAVCYSSAPLALSFIGALPMVGLLGALVSLWRFGLLIQALSALQRTTFGRALAVFLIPSAALCCCCGVVAAGAISAVVAGVGHH